MVLALRQHKITDSEHRALVIHIFAFLEPDPEKSAWALWT